jgi:hypothetical protein
MTGKESICLRCKNVNETKTGCTLDYLFLPNKSACAGLEEE